MATPQSGTVIKRYNFAKNAYETVRSLRGSDYRVEDDTGVILTADLDTLAEDGRLVFERDGETVLVAERTSIDDREAYTLIDGATEAEIAVMIQDGSAFSGDWVVGDPVTETPIVRFKSKGSMVNVAKAVTQLGKLRSHEYEIIDEQEGRVGSIKVDASGFTITHHIDLDSAATVPQEITLAAAIAFDAVESA